MAYASMRTAMPPSWPPYHGVPPRATASEGPFSGDDDYMSDHEMDPRQNVGRGRARRAPVRSATDGLRNKDLNRMEGRLRDRQTGRSRSQTQNPHDYNLYSDPRAPPPDAHAYPRYPGPPAPPYEAGGQSGAPYYDAYGNAFGAPAPPAMHNGYPHPPHPSHPAHPPHPPPMGGDPSDPMNPFGPYGAPGPAHGDPQASAQPKRSRARPREDSDLNKLKQDIRAIRAGQNMHREDPYMQHPAGPDPAEMYRGEERRRRKKTSNPRPTNPHRFSEPRMPVQDDMARDIERQFFDNWNHRPVDDSGFRGSSNRDMESMMRALLMDPRARNYLQAQQGYRPDEMNRLFDLLRSRDQLNDNQNPIARLLAQNGSVDRDGILKRLDDMMYHQRRIEETVGELLYRVREDAMVPRPGSSGRPRLPMIDRGPASVTSGRPSLDDDIQSLRESLQRLPMGRDGQTPLPPEVEQILSRQSTEATLQALRHRSRPGSPNESDEYTAPNYQQQPRRKATKAQSSARLRQRMQATTDVDDEDLSDDTDEGFDMVPPQPPYQGANGSQRRRAARSNRREDPGDTTAADDADHDAARPSRSSGRRGRGIRIRPATESPAVAPNPRMPSRSKSRPRPAINAARRSGHISSPEFEVEESDEYSDEEWDEPNPFSRAPSRGPPQHRFGPSHTAHTASKRWRAGSVGMRGKPRAPSPPHVG